MCGIVAVVPSYHEVDEPKSVQTLIDALPEIADGRPDAASVPDLIERLAEVGKQVECALDLFRSASAVRLLGDPCVEVGELQTRLTALSAWALRVEQWFDAQVDVADTAAVEATRASVRCLRDHLFAIEHDCLRVAQVAMALTDGSWTERSAVSYAAIATALDVIDRLEVRGRDSAGMSVWVELAATDRPVLDRLEGLSARSDPLLRDGSVLRTRRGVCFVYKRAAIVGRLGDNTAHLRAGVRADDSLHAVLGMPSAAVTVLAHTRWASVGRTSASNAHPVDNAVPSGAPNGPLAIAVLNGDVDNYLALSEGMGYVPDLAGVTTDAKLIPLLVSEGLRAGRSAPLAVADMLASCAGSMAIAVQTEVSGDDVFLAAKGSGQSLYVGLSTRGYLVASEVYGLVGLTQQFIRVDGADTAGGHGTVVRLSRAGRGRAEYIDVWDAAGEAVPLAWALQTTAVTSRDLSLGTYEHYLDKELHDAPESFRRTLRDRVARHDGRLEVALPDSSVPPNVRERVAAGAITQVVVVGQGTAAVAAQGIAHVVELVAGPRLHVSAFPATEFSAWYLRRDMSDTLVVAVSQSGSTTDTNRAVDLARARGSAVISIVNRRDSDLAHKSDGVVYTSDGRDVELAVASTKAFYGQIAAGSLLGLELGRAAHALDPNVEATLIQSLLAVPAQLAVILSNVDAVRGIARIVATAHPNWAVVGSGPNRVAANEIRIKLSELCYKAVAVDAIEDKKHIDLSAEALVIVCAAGAPPNQIADLAKEVEILKAHNNRAVVICDVETADMWATDLVIPIPSAHPTFAWLLATAAGHLFGYHAALAIDAAAQPLREALQELEHLVDTRQEISRTLPGALVGPIESVLSAAASGALRGVLSSSATMGLVRIVAPPGHSFELAADVRPAAREDEIRAGLETAIMELTRSIDTIKHQAKTVTVGTSRSDSDLFDNVLVEAIRAVGADVRSLSRPVLDVLRSLAAVVAEATGVTRYAVSWADPAAPGIRVITKSGSAAHLPSRADTDAPLTGSKRRVVELGAPRLIRGRADGRVVVIVPERLAGTVRTVSLVHVTIEQAVSADVVRRAVESMGDRADEIVAAVTELAPDFQRDAVWAIRPVTLLLAPLEQVVDEALSSVQRPSADQNRPMRAVDDQQG